MLGSGLVIGAVSAWLATSPGLPERQTTGTAPVVSQEFLESIERLDCSFAVAAEGRWNGPVPTVRTQTLSTPLTVRFSDIDVVDGSAAAAPDGRRDSVSVRSDRSNLYFLEVMADGVVKMTTVFSQQTSTGRLKAVHTQTGGAAGQFYGECTVRK